MDEQKVFEVGQEVRVKTSAAFGDIATFEAFQDADFIGRIRRYDEHYRDNPYCVNAGEKGIARQWFAPDELEALVPPIPDPQAEIVRLQREVERLSKALEPSAHAWAEFTAECEREMESEFDYTRGSGMYSEWAQETGYDISTPAYRAYEALHPDSPSLE